MQCLPVVDVRLGDGCVSVAVAPIALLAIATTEASLLLCSRSIFPDKTQE